MKCGSLVILSRWRPGGHREDTGSARLTTLSGHRSTQEDRTGHSIIQQDTEEEKQDTILYRRTQEDEAGHRRTKQNTSFYDRT